MFASVTALSPRVPCRRCSGVVAGTQFRGGCCRRYGIEAIADRAHLDRCRRAASPALAEHSRGQDDAALTAVWDCTAGEFRWRFGWDETVMILEGEVHITTEDGIETCAAAPATSPIFAGGTWATWRIDRYVRKGCLLPQAVPEAA